MKITYLVLFLSAVLAMPICAMDMDTNSIEEAKTPAYVISEKEQENLDTLERIKDTLDYFGASRWLTSGAEAGFEEQTRLLLSLTFSIEENSEIHLGKSEAFIAAAKKDHVNILKILSESTSDINLHTVNQALYYSVCAGAMNSIRYVLDDAPLTASKTGISHAHNFTQGAPGYGDIGAILREAGSKKQETEL